MQEFIRSVKTGGWDGLIQALERSEGLLQSTWSKDPLLELPSGKGFADVVYLPKRNSDKPALVVELKWNKSAKGAISQIKERQYADWLEEYTGNIHLVRINYDKKKGHTCLIESYSKDKLLES